MDNKRFMVMRGDILSTDLDENLQAIVKEASNISGYPIALVNIILKRTQFFRAHIGLPEDLASLRSTDTCVSFCQYVVRSKKPLHIKDAKKEVSLPQQLVDLYGIRSYYGFPLKIDNEVIGSLCVISTKPNELSEAVISKLTELADQASVRLNELASNSISNVLIKDEKYPEKRKVWEEVTSARQEIRMAMLGLSPVLKLQTEGYTTQKSFLQDAALSFKDLHDAVRDLDQALTKLKSLK